MRTIAIIPARSGSRRLPGKNLCQIKGKSLVEYAIQAAIDSQVFSEVILTSNDSATLMLMKEKFNESIGYHLRPESLSGDNIQLRTLICYMIDLLTAESKIEDEEFNIALLIPTSPLRRAEDIRSSFALLQKNYDKIDGIMSVALLTHPPLHSLRIDNKGFIKVMFPEYSMTQSQYLEPAYIHDGSIIFVKSKSFRMYGDFYMPKMLAFYIDEKRAIDINTAFDLKLAELLMEVK